jgi:DMSO/TMAO reductase YedYZ molybdopterin-dependent catalytic subunit
LQLVTSPTSTLPSSETFTPSEIFPEANPGTLAGTVIAEPSNTFTTPHPNETVKSTAATTMPTSCQLDPVSQPPWPDEIVAPNQLDPETGLHMTGKPQPIDLATYRLNVTGMVDHPLSLTYDDLRCMRQVTDNPDLVCLGVFIDYASWTGVPIKDILELAGVMPEATKVTLVSADGYDVSLPLETASTDKNFLAYEVNGNTLPVLHGFPLRAVFPNMGGSYWIKWLVEIKIS